MKELVQPVLGPAVEFVAGELHYWRDELTGPWERGRPGRTAEIGRWIGLTLAASAAVAGIVAALRAERPWE